MALTFRYGFKADCERISLALRDELGLQAADKLDPQVLAGHFAIPVLSLETFRSACGHAVDQLVVRDSGSFSAATVFCGPRRLIIYNPVHASGRHANSVAHELSHVILEHTPGSVLDSGGERRWSANDEREADWLAGALLAPRQGVLDVIYRLGSVAAAASHYGISEQLMRWRLNHTGVKRQIERASAKIS